MAIAKQDFLWYKRKEEIKSIDEKHLQEWEKEGFIELEVLVKKEVEIIESKPEVKPIVKEVLKESFMNKVIKSVKSKKK